MKITAVSDLHGDKPKLLGGDLLIIAGDLTAMDKLSQYQDFCFWLHNQSYKRKIVIGGNHDMRLEKEAFKFDEHITGASYLCDSGTEFEGLKIWGTPWTLYFDGVNPDCSGFMHRSEAFLKEKFDMIPENTDILISHGPCFKRLDETLWKKNAGSIALRDRVDYLRGKKLRYHFHGHIHEAYGMHEEGGLKTYNVARMTRAYYPGNKIVNLEI
jgi:Icc-related predicted phosphoesterase